MGIPKYIINRKNSGGGGGAADLSVSITHSELKALRDGGNLAPGTWYRITDYQTTIPPTFTADVHSAGHLFDVIVRADDDRHLNENAYAAHHGGDAYFGGSKLEAWELKYCIDNDTDRFQLAYAGGKGVIYRMKDEFGNECPYDFKNIMFSRPMTNGEYDPEGQAAYVYTFNIFMSGIAADATVAQAERSNIYCFGNKIKESWHNNKMTLEDNVFLLGGFSDLKNFDCKHNSIGSGSAGNTLSTGSGNRLGDNCTGCLLEESCKDNRLEAGCTSVKLAPGVTGNTLGVNCKGINLGVGSTYNHFGNKCEDIFVRGYCCGITVFDDARCAEVSRGASEELPITGCQVMGCDYNGGIVIFRVDMQCQVAGIDRKGNIVVFNPAAS